MQLTRRHFLGAAGAAGLGLSVGMPWKASADSNPSRVVTPGGGTDDHLIIQDALSRGGLVEFDGIFQISDTVKLPPNVSLAGRGRFLTRFVQHNPAVGVVQSAATSGISISGITFSGGVVGGDFSGVSGLVLADVAFLDATSDGLRCYSIRDFTFDRVEASAPNNGSSGVKLGGACRDGDILYLYSHDNGVQGEASDYGDGLYLSGDTLQNIYVFRAVCSGNNRDGIVAGTGCDGVTLDSCHCESNGHRSGMQPAGIWMETAGVVNIDNCFVDQTEATAWRHRCVVASGEGGFGGRVAHNTLRGTVATHYGITAGRRGFNIYDNQIFGTDGGILLEGYKDNADYNTLKDNQLYVVDRGIGVISAIDRAEYLVIRNNQVHAERGGRGISLNENVLVRGAIEYNVVTGITGVPGNAIEVDRLERSHVRGNQCPDAAGEKLLVRARDRLSLVEGNL